jgi:hypothetical protein
MICKESGEVSNVKALFWRVQEENGIEVRSGETCEKRRPHSHRTRGGMNWHEQSSGRSGCVLVHDHYRLFYILQLVFRTCVWFWEQSWQDL